MSIIITGGGGGRGGRGMVRGGGAEGYGREF